MMLPNTGRSQSDQGDPSGLEIEAAVAKAEAEADAARASQYSQ
jgi:hypothetical protein